MNVNQAYLDSIVGFLTEHGYTVNEIKNISYGVQFRIVRSETNELIRIYQNTKGAVKLDLSQIKDESVRDFVSSYSVTGTGEQKKMESFYALKPPLIGSDEAGKGDYFGFLSVAAVYADEIQYAKLRSAGICDSKNLNDDKIAVFAEKIKLICPMYSVASIPNTTFNQDYKKLQNINAILGEAHGSVIRDLIERTGCNRILTDKFGNTHWVADALRGYSVHLVQEPKGEQNLAVAAASILARKAFTDSVASLRAEYAIEFPLGAGSMVDECGKRFVSKYGAQRLNEVAKISFKNTDKILMMQRD